ncbi:HGGxSTG domain-containing protein [Alteripontixanthobacter muriae]|uniref:HGGxSTG domain-containing protein n=1 Tax=Alteripontixanthobacter muriae TaxID=2705546 RepID=UPI0038BA03A0
MRFLSALLLESTLIDWRQPRAAWPKTRKRTECQSPAVRGKRRCRMHGGTNPGAPKGNSNAWKHGGRSAAARAAARWIKHLVRSA